ncbi:PREDICTED: uncharacterized protein LOC106745577 isoform X2 [Dinoponera quadriceps]|nr:PREDICTED: uncharacterized protein LOC106745577 isoform X2 [Dinoponera quadriceps]XP_014476764.1 PREDICTED: uncharacterized protein LOC106745577 isoform X2 [Dinoponera quadriceps]
MENCGGGQRLPPDGDEFPAAYQEFSGGSQPYRYIAATARTATITANGGLCNENEPFRGSETFKMLANDSNVVGSRSIILSDSKMTLTTSAENVRQDINKVALANMENARSESKTTAAASVDNVCQDTKSEMPNEERNSTYQASEDTARKNSATVAASSPYCQTNNSNLLMSEKKMEIAAYYHKDVAAIEEVPSHVEKDTPVDSPPPLPLTGPPKMEQTVVHARNVPTMESPQRKFSLNGDLWRQDDKSERSVRDKIAMFSSQSSLDAPLFPNAMAAAAVTSNGKRLSKYKSSEDVCCDDKSNGQKDRSSFFADRTQSSFDLTDSARTSSMQDSTRKYSQRAPSLPQTAQPALSSPTTSTTRVPKTLPVVPPKNTSLSNPLAPSYDKQTFSNATTKNYCTIASESSGNLQPNIAYPNVNKAVGPCNNSNSLSKTPSTSSLMRATSFSGSTPFVQDRSALTAESINNSQIARTNSLASTFRRPGEDARRSSLNQLIEQRRRSISKLRGLVIPEKDPVPIDQPIVDLPEIKSRDSILLHQMPKANIQDKWGSQSSIASNASTASAPLKATTSFKMPAPQIHSKYSPAFKRKSLTVYGTSLTTSSSINGSPIKGNPQQSATPAFSEPPKSLESICSPTRSDYSFEFASATSSPDGTRTRPKTMQRRARLDYDDSDNDSAVSSSQSSISRGFSPPMSPVPSERSTISSERSYVSTELSYQRRPLIADNVSRASARDVRDSASVDKDQFGGRIGVLGERTYLTERSSSSSSGSNPRSPQPNELASSRNSQIPQRQLRRSNSTDTNCSTSSTLTSGSQASAESLSRRVLKPQSVEAINRKNILASARCRSGRDLNGSPLIQRKFSDDEDAARAVENGGAVHPRVNDPGNEAVSKQDVKIAYIEVADPFAEDEGSLFQKKLEEPKLPPKRSVPPPAIRPPKSEMLEASNDMKMWVRAEAKTLARSAEEKSRKYDKTPPVAPQNLDASPVIHTTKSSRGSMFNEAVNAAPLGGLSSKNRTTMEETKIAAAETAKQQCRASLASRKGAEDQNDLLTILTTKSRSRSAIHVDEGTFGRSRSQMSLEDILGAKADPKMLRAPSMDPKIEKNGAMLSPQAKSNWEPRESRYGRRGSAASNDSWSEERPFVSKIPTLGRVRPVDSGDEMSETIERTKSAMSKIPTSRGLNRRSASVTDMKKALEKIDAASSHHSQTQQHSGAHNRFPSLDSSVDENVGGAVGTDTDRCYGEQFGSISSLASSTSLISQQELAQLVEEASLEEARGAHDVVVVLLHKENPTGSVGITLAGGADCEVKEITVHRVLTHSIADKDGRMQRGDRILSINGRSTRGLTHRESMAVLKQPRSEVVLVVSRARMEEGCKLRSRTASVETIVEGLETNGSVEDTAWGPPSTVAVYKDGAGLGFSLEGGRDSPLGDRPLIIKKIFTGGAAEKTGALRAGDQLLEVNGNDVTRMSRIEAWSLMKKLHDGEVNLLVRHPATKSS